MHRVHTEDDLSKSEKRAFWDEVIRDFLASNLGLTQCSKQHGLRYDHLNYYVAAHRRKQANDFIPVAALLQKHFQSENKLLL